MFDDFGNGPGGPMISGKWLNKRTGKTIVVRDSMIDGDKMVIMTNQGPLDFEIFSRDYIQASDEVYDESGKVVETKPVEVSEITEDNGTPVQFANPEKGMPTIKLEPEETPKINVSINNFELIDKIFKKVESKPHADLKINWANFPQNELSMLVNYLDVKIDDIVAYIGKYLINDDLLNDALLEFLRGKGLK